ncbi:dTMP kinase [Candidatus Parcubacteria bacterium]|nr:dTMP kinase [Candidatus Parcubacteria bacterium]
MKKNPYQGKFIVFEGIDGSGQSTQADKLVDYLSRPEQKFQLGKPGAHLTKEPTNNLIGGLIRGQLTHNWQTKQECLQLLFAADRAHHLEKEIIPLLEKGITVVCDRYFFSTIAYGALEIKDWDWLIEINKHFLSPDLTFLLEVEPKICLERIEKNRFSIELFEKQKILEKVWQNYEKLSKEFKNIYIINGEQSPENVFEQIKKII